MQADFWRERWRAGQIGFHEGKPNEYLVAHHAHIAACKRVLVPLCGKTDDLAYLAAHGHEVVGVELVEDAVRQFFAEHGVTAEVTQAGGFAMYRAGAISVLAGDLFRTTPELVGAIDAIYDRAALVALPPDMRRRYAEHLRAIAPDARATLLVSIEYPAGAMDGPPFSVEEPEIRALFAGARIDVLDARPDPRGRLDGKLVERCYALTKT